ncbi:unnamed protein product [Blepharisma stoltei]|uniref:Vacuolar ATPase assembly integral membrane protein VMA21 homolog n=1 Tax=Blepharisma stoltei TaxID=1481888 RepID=A0AAU9JQ60_9CILI|nr:unnamed protein product [Blepharisma stoltei]
MPSLVSGGAKTLLVTALLFIVAPIVTLFSMQYLTQDLAPTTRTLISGISAVIVVHIVIAFFLYTLFKYMRKND